MAGHEPDALKLTIFMLVANMTKSTWGILLLGGLNLVHGRSLWSSALATHGSKDNDEYILKTTYPLGNGKLGGRPHETLI